MKSNRTKKTKAPRRVVLHAVVSRRQTRLTLKQLVNKHRGHVIEALQLWGDFPDCNEDSAVFSDWTHVLMERMASLMEHVRLDESDPDTIEDIRRDLSKIIGTCEEWDKRL